MKFKSPQVTKRSKEIMVPKLTQEQQEWLEDKLKNYNLLYVGFYGSHVYGLDRLESDIDIKAVCVPKLEELLLGQGTKTHNHKNDKLNIEIEVKTISSFLNSAKSCDTNVVDMLHTPKEFWIGWTPEWEELVSYRQCLYSKNMTGLLGYIKTHTHKYSHKIERYEEMKYILKLTELYKCPTEAEDTILSLVSTLNFKDFLSKAKYTKSIELVEKGTQQYLEVCGKKYIYTWSVNQLVDALEKEINRYGQRTETGVNSGLDSKSLSHALRVLYETKEILEYNTVTFPLTNAQEIKDIKVGVNTDLPNILNTIDKLYDECIELMNNSDLPEQTDISNMVKVMVDYYKQLL